MILSFVSSSILFVLLFFGPALAAIAFRRSLSIVWHQILIGVCLVYAIAPLLVAFIADGIANDLGCTVQIVTYTCPNNAGMGSLITLLTFGHWLTVVTLPSGLAGIIGLVTSWRIQVSRSGGQVEQARRPSRFYRRRQRKVLAGVCAGIAHRWGLPVLGIRAAAIVLLFIAPYGLLAYVWIWLAFPLEPGTEAAS